MSRTQPNRSVDRTIAKVIFAAVLLGAPPKTVAAPDPSEHDKSKSTTDRMTFPLDASNIGSYSSKLVLVNDDFVADVYVEALRSKFATKAAPQDEVESALIQPVIEGIPAFNRLAMPKGEHTGIWEFFSPESEKPTRAWQNIDRSDEHGYTAERIGYCKGSQEVCTAWFENGRHLSPQPNISSGKEATRTWAIRVMFEKCIQGTEFRPNTAILQRAASQAGLPDATVYLTILLNSCGDVRGAWVETSSGHRGLDEAAVEWALRARFPSELQKQGALVGHGLLSRLPVNFTIK